jgi:hypothetical protein
MKLYGRVSRRRLFFKLGVYIREFAWAVCGKCIILCILVQQFENFVAIVSLPVSAAISPNIA